MPTYATDFPRFAAEFIKVRWSEHAIRQLMAITPGMDMQALRVPKLMPNLVFMPLTYPAHKCWEYLR